MWSNELSLSWIWFYFLDLFGPCLCCNFSDAFCRFCYFHAASETVKKISKRNVVALTPKSAAVSVVPSQMGMELQGAVSVDPRSHGVNMNSSSVSRAAFLFFFLKCFYFFPFFLWFWQCCVCCSSLRGADIWAGIWPPCVSRSLLRLALSCAPNLHPHM